MDFQEGNVKEIFINETPPVDCEWRYIPLYKKSETGALIFWQIGFDGVKFLKMSHGQEGGIITNDKTEVELNQSGRDINQQAVLNARKRYLDKYNLGYRPAGSTECVMKKGMKGHPYDEDKHKLVFPVYIQPKLDGVRALCHLDESGEIYIRSYNNLRYTKLDHLHPVLLDLFKYLPPGSTIDGELYNHTYKFAELTSIIRKSKTPHPQLPTVQYHIFDVDYFDSQEGAPPFDLRYKTLVEAYTKYCQDEGEKAGVPYSFPPGLVIVETQIASNKEEIKQYHDHYETLGYEGVMIKNISIGRKKGSKEYNLSLYVNKKANNILKYKSFLDEEGTILDVVQCSGTQSDCGKFTVKDPRGNKFSLAMAVVFAEKRKYLDNPDDYIGKKVTYRYQELSPDGVPRFPRGICIRDYE